MNARVVKFVQTLLLDESDSTISVELIEEKIDEVLGLRPAWGVDLDRSAVVDELIRRFSIWVGKDATLSNNIGHEAWLTAARKSDWRYWQRYSEMLEAKLAPKAVEGLDATTDSILELLEDPERPGPWDRRGLVVGHVQSGKTGNYTGLICKAADAGYKIIIVLAGLHNNLRSQTQMRLDEGFLGYETSPHASDLREIGVGLIDSDPVIRPNYATNRTDGGDFNVAFANNLGISPEQRPWLFVVKKNKRVLERLLGWIRSHVANAKDPETGRRIVTNLPLLVIDDEADHASVDTGEQLFDGTGAPDPDHEPTAINRLIRRTLNTFERSAYVGYTATPFANIFIHERGSTPEEGLDLFPESFIISLAAPSSYCGPAKVFGLQSPEGRKGLPLIRPVSDFDAQGEHRGWMPPRHQNGHAPRFEGEDVLPPSLKEAVDAFLLTCAVRQLRGQGRDHSSMLVHVTRFNSVQKEVTSQIDEYVRQLRQRLTRGIGAREALARLQELWVRDFVPTNNQVRELDPDESGPALPPWNEVTKVLPEVISDISVRMINGTAKDALDYADNSATGLKVIAVGGDKLARGLTLEGLCVSYFLRASKMYDTLMQMGRWFGYRPRYLDLCRLYTTSELIEWFGHIADAAEELREEFELMAASGSTPRQYGLKVQSHSVMMVTSRLKMRRARNLMLSFSGQLLETVVFSDAAKEKNRQALTHLVEGRPPAETTPIRRARPSGVQEWKGAFWSDVPAQEVIQFLRAYRTDPTALKVNSVLLADFIDQMSSQGELTSWTVALIGGGTGPRVEVSEGISVEALLRSNSDESKPGYRIGRLLSPRDEAIDLNEAEWAAALAKTREIWHADPGRRPGATEPDTPNGPAIRRIRGFGSAETSAHPERGLLLLYFVVPKETTPDAEAVAAFGVSFPGSDNQNARVDYKVNNVHWEQEFGASE